MVDPGPRTIGAVNRVSVAMVRLVPDETVVVVIGGTVVVVGSKVVVVTSVVVVTGGFGFW